VPFTNFDSRIYRVVEQFWGRAVRESALDSPSPGRFFFLKEGLRVPSDDSGIIGVVLISVRTDFFHVAF